MLLPALGVLLASCLAGGCDFAEREPTGLRDSPERNPVPRASQPPPASAPLAASKKVRQGASDPEGLPPLWNDEWLVPLSVPGFADAQVALPRGAVTPRRVIVALHGYSDRPDWQCGAWTGIGEAKMFVLCPTGVALPKPLRHFSYKSASETRAEVDAGLAALRERFGPYLSAEPVILVGFSLGAQRAAHLAADDPARFPIVALVEGGTRAWSQSFARKFREGGGQRALFVCTQFGCRNLVRRLEGFTQAGDVLARGAYLGNFGHHMGPQVTGRIKEHFAWLVDPTPNG
jgi:pimeloyl-ACP methyl ester carboxylesterase